MFALGICLLIVAFIVTLVAGIMFIVAAFRVSAMWGLLVLFVPFAPLVFLIKYWQEAKKSFLWNLAGIGVGVVGFMIFAGAAASRAGEMGEQIAAEMQREAATTMTSAARPATPARPSVAAPVNTTTSVGDALPLEPPAEPVDEAAAEQEQLEAFARLQESADTDVPAGTEIPPRDLARHIGERLLLIEDDGREVRGTLVSVGGRTLRIERELSGGSVSYDVARSRIKSVRAIE